MKKGEKADKIIRDTSNRYNSIAIQLDKNLYTFIIKWYFNKESICNFIKLLVIQLQLTVNKDHL